ncbi:hypothetical protein DV738_g3370, partial [Chaetothyriales sp. CBS 135597]
MTLPKNQGTPGDTITHQMDVEKGNDALYEIDNSQMPLEGDESEPLDDQSHNSTVVGTPESSSLKERRVGSIVVEPEPEPPTLPSKHGNKLTRYLFYNFLTSYRKSFAVIFFANIAVLIALTVKGNGTPPTEEVGSASSANLMVAILFRQENFVNLVYEIFTCAPHSLPLWIRRRLAKVFHYGGCHSGCGTAAVFWYLLYTALSTKQYVQDKHSDVLANMITSWILILMFCFILGGAHPKFRVRYHDTFEAFHRFSGWIALCTFWVHNVFSAHITARHKNSTIGMVLVNSANFWCIIVSTLCTILSWSRLRLRKVYPEVLSDHATRLHFRYKAMAPFYGVKLSDKPLTEWHAFATIPDEDGKGFSVVVSNAGDWTKHHILNPPEKLWIRGYPLHGLLYTSKLFKQIVVVATGSGIGPTLSLMFADITPRRVLWSTPNPETTYGEGIIKTVLKADPNAIIWNTRKQGRPDMVQMTYSLVRECNAEAVFIISNPKVTRKVVYGMETRGIPAYGAIFDS